MAATTCARCGLGKAEHFGPCCPLSRTVRPGSTFTATITSVSVSDVEVEPEEIGLSPEITPSEAAEYEEPTAAIDAASWEEERRYASEAPLDVPLCSMCAHMAVAETGDTCAECLAMWKPGTHILTEEYKAARRERIEEAAAALQANAVDSAKDHNSKWREMDENDWLNALYDEKVSQIVVIADQYRIDPDELRAEVGLL